MVLAGKKILITGSAGMLASDLYPILVASGAECVLSDSRSVEGGRQSFYRLDVSDPESVKQTIAEIQPDWIINCAAFTKVDDAEQNYRLAFLVNSLGPKFLAEAASTIGARILHVSSDYVFGADVPYGERRKPLSEKDTPKPCGLYGLSKFFGDELVQAKCPDSFVIVRTSWLHGVHGPNFLDTMIHLSKEKDELRVVNDQYGSPTSSFWLSQVILELIAKEARGIFHAASRGDVTWLDFAAEIFRQIGANVKVSSQTTAELNRPAPRPAYSTLDVTKLETLLGRPCPSWQEDIAEHIRRRQEIAQ